MKSLWCLRAAIVKTFPSFIFYGAFIFPLLFGCRSKDVNGGIEIPVVMPTDTGFYGVASMDKPRAQEGLLTSTRTAIAGKVVLRGPVPQGLPHLLLSLEVQKDSKWTSVTEFSTDSSSEFTVTQRLRPGYYRLKVKNPKFKGEMSFHLEKPLENLILEIEAANP